MLFNTHNTPRLKVETHMLSKQLVLEDSVDLQAIWPKDCSQVEESQTSMDMVVVALVDWEVSRADCWAAESIPAAAAAAHHRVAFSELRPVCWLEASQESILRAAAAAVEAV